MDVSLALAKRLYISLDFCYTFVLQKSSDVLCCGQTVRHFTIQFIRLHKRFFPFATTDSKTTQKSADFHDKMECDRRKHLYLKIYHSVSVLFHESQRKAKAGNGYFEKVSTQVDIENAGGPVMRTRPDTRP